MSRYRAIEEPRIALVGPWIANKGDELMLEAVLEHYGEEAIGAPRELWPMGVPDTLVPQMLSPHGGDFRNALEARDPGLFARLGLKRALMTFGGRGVPRLFGARSTHRVSMLLDCSGFAYGDAWSPARMLQRRGYYRWLKNRGVRIVLLPQALGPFEKLEIREAARALFALGDAIYARDADSLKHLRALDLPKSVRLGQCPDITHLLKGHPPQDRTEWERRVAIVPNTRMIDRSPPERATAYLDFLAHAVGTAESEGCEPWIVLHETNDGDLVSELNDRLPHPLPVLDVDALATKGVLGCCRAVIASRYHALVSSLSQAVPVIGTSWSHKYDRLFDEYGHGEFLLRPETDRELLPVRLRDLLSNPTRGDVAARLGMAAASQQDRVRTMWSEVDQLSRD